jgi:hypothetical protein
MKEELDKLFARAAQIEEIASHSDRALRGHSDQNEKADGR